MNRNLSHLLGILCLGLSCSDEPGTYTAVAGDSDDGVFGLSGQGQPVAVGSLHQLRLSLPDTGRTTRCGFVGESTCSVTQEMFDLVELKSLDPDILQVEGDLDKLGLTTSEITFWVRSKSSGTAKFQAEVRTKDTNTRLIDTFELRSAEVTHVEFGGALPSKGSLFGECAGGHVVEGAQFRVGAARYNQDEELVGSDTIPEHWLFALQGPGTLNSDFSDAEYSVGIVTTGLGEVVLSSEFSTSDVRVTVIPVTAIDDAMVTDSLGGEAGDVSSRFKVQVAAMTQGIGVCAGPIDTEFVSETPGICTVVRDGAQQGEAFISSDKPGECRVRVNIPGSSWTGTTLTREII